MRFHAVSPSVFTISDFLSDSECDDLITLAERQQFSSAGVRTAAGEKAMPMIRNNERTMIVHPQWVQMLWQRLNNQPLPSFDGQNPCGLPRELRFYKYSAGQRFKMHKDGPWMEDGLRSRLTMLVYLNEGFEGGQTQFKEFAVTPVRGEALLFVHETWHEGAAVTSGVKYVLRSDVMYR
jgi:predicted 2-oxoglutarate/Fe(II)-dependent dioxygenase YbiX